MLAFATDLDPAFVLSNRVEALLWISISIGCVIAAIRHRGVIRRDLIFAFGVFGIFGASDFVEATTGAWWRPWWLLVWKGLSILALLVLLVRYAHRRRDQSS